MVVAEPADELVLAYPDGPHDAETLLVEPRTLAIYIVARSRGAAALFQAMDARPGKGVGRLERLGTIEAPGSSAGDGEFAGGAFAPDGRRVVLRTARHAVLYRVVEPFVASFRCAERIIELPRVQNGESVTFRSDGKALITTSEGESSPVHEIALE
ncbi:MAG: hypothetical protein U1E76_09565 [Planctomycetota bacterium]